MIFKGPILTCVSILIPLGVFVVFSNVRIKTSDQLSYQKIVQEREALHSTDVLERHPSTQLRKNAQKDIWTCSGGERVHFQMQSDLSKLVLKQQKDQFEAKEELEQIVCTNTTGKMIAKTGSFEYPSNQLIANEVKCEHPLGTIRAQNAVLESNEILKLTDGVILSGNDFILHSQVAKCIVDSFVSEKEIEFSQDVNIFLSDGITATGDTALYKTGSLTLNPAHLSQEDRYFLDGDDCLITILEEKPQKIEMTKNVRFFSSTIQNKNTFALADHLIFHPEEQILVLTAIAPKRVLVWQEGMSLSAPVIHIQKESIQGKGDVRFTFSSAEQNIIDQFISKYL